MRVCSFSAEVFSYYYERKFGVGVPFELTTRIRCSFSLGKVRVTIRDANWLHTKLINEDRRSKLPTNVAYR